MEIIKKVTPANVITKSPRKGPVINKKGNKAKG